MIHWMISWLEHQVAAKRSLSILVITKIVALSDANSH